MGALAGVSRSSLYYRPAGESAENLALMREIDEVHLKYPFYGVRQMRSHLRLGGVVVGVNRVRRLMRVMGSGAVQPPPRTSSPAPGHKVYPYLLGGVDVVEPDQAWCADITYIPVMSGFFYLVAVMDWATRRVLSWRLSNTMEVGFCLGALEDALRTGTPEIFNTDQGSQFTSLAFTQRVLSSGARMSMDGRGRFMDNIFIERLWRSLKYEAVYLCTSSKMDTTPGRWWVPGSNSTTTRAPILPCMGARPRACTSVGGARAGRRCRVRGGRQPVKPLRGSSTSFRPFG